MLKQLFYRGPSIEVLHDDYAKKGHIDDKAPVQASHEVRVDAPVERVWELLSNVSGWGTWDPAVRDVQLDSTVAEDARFTWANGRARMKSRFAVVDPGRELTWTRGLLGRQGRRPACAGSHRRRCHRVRCEESMAGPLLVLFYNSAKLQAGTERWLATLKTAAEQR